MLNGIKKNNVGQWVAFRNGKPVGWHSGPGSKANAIREAGTNTVLTDDQLRPVVQAAVEKMEKDAADLTIDLARAVAA